MAKIGITTMDGDCMWVIKIAIYRFISVINFLIVARVLFSWISRDFQNPIFRFLYQITEPILAPFRSLLDRIGVGGMIDFSPLLAILAIDIIGRFLVTLL